MSEPNVRADAVDVEQIMRQIRARISEKRGADYTETELRQLASVKLEKFMDPQGLRSDLIEQFRKMQGGPGTGAAASAEAAPAGPPPSLYRRLRRFVGSTVRLLSNPYRILALDNRMQSLEIRLQERDSLYYELMHNLTLEVTRLGIEVHNITMRVESLSSRLDFDERRGRSLESVVQYRPPVVSRPQNASPAPAAPAVAESSPAPDNRPRPMGGPATPAEGGDQGGGERRRRRRRRRRRPGQTFADNAGRPQDAAGGPPADRNTGAADAGAFNDGPADDDAGDDDGPDSTEP